jgi:sensor histidine kinase YesM
VIQRIKTYYGPEYGVEFASELGKGTVVTITIPQERMAEELDAQKSKQ